MAYQRLDKLFYADSSSERKSANEAEARRRLEAPSAFRTGIDVGTGELFLLVPRELSIATEKVLRIERKVSQLWRILPGIARGAYIRSLIMDEVVCTNEMEGVRSTRRQIKDALDSIEESGSEPDRRIKQFVEFANLYLGLTEGRHTTPEKPADIRTIYDAVVAGTLRDSDKPDGELFRAGGVDITTPAEKVAHAGIEPEGKIVSLLKAMITLTSSEDIPELYSALLSHFLFEYIHPFYDGNGRTGRYLLALYLSAPLSQPTALSLSRVIAEHKGAYYRAFSVTENPLNHGEGTFFVLQMMEFIKEAQEDIVAELEKRRDGLNDACARLETVQKKFSLSDRAVQMLFHIVQIALFGAFPDVSLRELAAHIELTAQSTRKYVSDLECCGLIEAVSRRPLRLVLTDRGRAEFDLTD